MRYHPDEILDLMAQIDEQGGRQLPGRCATREYPLTGDSHGPVTLEGCGSATLLAVPYDRGKLPSEVRVCAVDDDVGRWPRFGGDAFATQERA